MAVIREAGGSDRLEFPLGQVVYRVAAYLSDPRVSPDGTRVAFIEHPEKFDNRGMVRVVDRAGVLTTLTGEYWGTEGMAWSPDGHAVMYSGGTASEYRVYSAPANGGSPPIPLMSSAGSLYLHDIASNGRVVVTREGTRTGVVARGAGQDEGLDLTVLDQSWSPLLSPDGRFLVFGDGRSGADYGVVMRPVDGSPPVRLGDGHPRSISPDGRWIAATLSSSGRCVLYPAGVGTMVTITMGPLERCVNARWFPDGNSLLLTGNESGKPTRAYRASLPGGTPEALLPAGVDARLVSESGRLLVRDAAGTWQRRDLDGTLTPMNGLVASDWPIEWAADELSVVVTSKTTIPAAVFGVDLVTGQRTKIDEFAPADSAGLLSLRPTAYRDNGRQYTYEYYRRLSILYLVSGVR